jgi:putative transposase
LKIKKAFKYRIYPNQEQEAALSIQFGHSRFVYNAALAARKAAYTETGKGINYNDTAQMLFFWKNIPPLVWLQEADSQVLQQKLKDLDRAYQNFFAGRAEYPQFKSKHQPQSIRYPQRFKINGSRVYLPKVGWVRTIFHRPIEGQMKNCTVSKTKTGKYFIAIQCEVEQPEPIPPVEVVGIDLGLKHFAVLSTGKKIDHPQYLRKTERQLKRAQRVLSRRQKGSQGREKARLRVAILHEKVANQRQDFLHKTSHQIANQFGHIKIENLNISGMLKNHSLAKSIADSGWGEFTRQLGYKSAWRGGITERIDRWYPSSKTCCVCGWVNQDLKLHHRFWTCQCGAEHDRDHNASVNIARFNATVGATESYAGGVRVNPASPLAGGSWTAKPEAQVL